MIQGTTAVDPNDPEYNYHSNDILSLLKDLETDFKGQKSTLDAEYGKTKTACDELKKSLTDEMSANKDAMDALVKNIAKLAKEIAQHRESLVEAEAEMKDDELYLKDLTKQCEARAHDFDQRASMRNSEVQALTQALEVLTNDVKGKADEVNKRALLLTKAVQVKKAAPVKAAVVAKPTKKSVQEPKAVKKTHLTSPR